MPDLLPEEEEAFADSLAEVRREFQQGLTDRLSRMESAFAVLERGFDCGAAEVVFRQSHSLKGTAGAFGADSLTGPAREISAIARGWVGTTCTTAEELSEVRRELGRLRQAVTDYLST
jgi:chemotaxis protein histidine kinase CheA